jgi:peroxiredoxin
MNPTRRQIVSALPALAASVRWREGLAQDSAAERETSAPRMPALGSYVKLPSMTLLDGRTFNPSQTKGRVTVVYWWASTCPFCALQSPEMQKLWQAQQGQELRMLALSVDKTPAEASAYLQKKGYTFPAAWVTAEVQQVLPKPRGLPVTLVLGREGQVLQTEKGQMFPEDVAQLASWLRA